MSERVFKNSELRGADLIIDAIYEAPGGSMAYEPISKLFDCANQGGFRAAKSTKGGYKYIVLYSSLGDLDWPDTIDLFTGIVTYYGDNKRPGHDIHETPLNGNLILRQCFDALHAGDRTSIPPIFFFTKGVKGRDAIFRGLLVPGTSSTDENEDLVAIWKSKEGKRFQNYRALFTVVDTGTISREWLNSLIREERPKAMPAELAKWQTSTLPAKPLTAERVTEHRTAKEQLPIAGSSEIEVLNEIYEHFKDDPWSFEKCAAEIVKFMDKNIASYDLTRRTRDGGVDAHAEYRIGLPSNNIRVSCAIEAKCYKPGSSVGVKETSRLISRLRFRQFGVLVTTSYVNNQAYKEILEDQHPVIIIAGIDIVKILTANNIVSLAQVRQWLIRIAETGI